MFCIYKLLDLFITSFLVLFYEGILREDSAFEKRDDCGLFSVD